MPAERNKNRMRKKTKPKSEPTIRAEYDFSGGQRGKYAAAYAAGTNVVVLDADVAKAFPTADAVNQALRQLLAARLDAEHSVG